MAGWKSGGHELTLGWVRTWVSCALIHCSVCRPFFPTFLLSDLFLSIIITTVFFLYTLGHSILVIYWTRLFEWYGFSDKVSSEHSGWVKLHSFYGSNTSTWQRLIRRFILFFFHVWAECLFELPFILLGLTISTLQSCQHCRIVSIYGKWIINTNNEGVRQANSKIWLSWKGIRKH